MSSQALYISDLLFQIKLLKDKVAAFESGEKYLRMKQENKKARDADARKIKRLEAELSSAHAQIVDVRNIWMQTNEDLLKEKNAELARKDAEIAKMQKALLQAQKQRDDALDKLKEKNCELYEVKAQLEDANEKNYNDPFYKVNIKTQKVTNYLPMTDFDRFFEATENGIIYKKR